MTTMERISRVPPWILFVVFGVGVTIIDLGAIPIAELVVPHLKDNSPRQRTANAAVAPSKPPNRADAAVAPSKPPNRADAAVAPSKPPNRSETGSFFSSLDDDLAVAQARLKQAKAAHDKKAIADAQKQYDAAKENDQALMTTSQGAQPASNSVNLASLSEPTGTSYPVSAILSAGASNPEATFALAEEYIQLGMKVLLTLVMAGASLFVVLSQRYTPQAKHWGYGMLGTILGWWVKI